MFMKLRYLVLSSFLLLVGCGKPTTNNKVRDIEEPTSVTKMIPIDVKKEGYGLDKDLVTRLTKTDGQGIKAKFGEKAIKEVRNSQFNYGVDLNDYEDVTGKFRYYNNLYYTQDLFYKDNFQMSTSNSTFNEAYTDEVSDAYLSAGLELEFDREYNWKEIGKKIEDELYYVYRDDYSDFDDTTQTHDLHQYAWFTAYGCYPKEATISDNLYGLTDGYYTYTSSTKKGYVLINETTKTEKQYYSDDVYKEFEEFTQNILFVDKEYNVYKAAHYYERFANYINRLDTEDLFNKMIPVRRGAKIFDIVYGDEENYADADEYLEAIPDTINEVLKIYYSVGRCSYSDDGSLARRPNLEEEHYPLSSNNGTSRMGVDGENIFIIDEAKILSDYAIRLDRIELVTRNIKKEPHGDSTTITNKFPITEEFAKALLNAMGAIPMNYDGDTYYVLKESTSKYARVYYPYIGEFTLDDMVIESLDSI